MYKVSLFGAGLKPNITAETAGGECKGFPISSASL